MFVHFEDNVDGSGLLIVCQAGTIMFFNTLLIKNMCRHSAWETQRASSIEVLLPRRLFRLFLFFIGAA